MWACNLKVKDQKHLKVKQASAAPDFSLNNQTDLLAYWEGVYFTSFDALKGEECVCVYVCVRTELNKGS